jgi:hypothetical protein
MAEPESSLILAAEMQRVLLRLREIKASLSALEAKLVHFGFVADESETATNERN